MTVSRRSLLTGSPGASSDFNICSLVVHARPEQMPSVIDALHVMAGVEIHGRSPQGKIVVTVESADDHALVQTMGRIGELAGVLSTALIFQHSEPQTSS
jgi:nitrate reductase NapD